MDRKEEILKTALKLFVEFGFHATPTSKIAKEAGVANGTLFHYFKTKEELILALFINIKERQTEEIFRQSGDDTSFKVLFKNSYINSLDWATENKTEFYFIQQFEASPFVSLVSSEEKLKQSKQFIDIIKSGIKNNLLKPLSADFILIMITSHIFGINHYLLQSDFSEDKKKKTISDSFDLLWDMIVNI